MEDSVRVLLRGVGEDLDREGLRDTPKVTTAPLARAARVGCSGPHFDVNELNWAASAVNLWFWTVAHGRGLTSQLAMSPWLGFVAHCEALET